MKPKSQSRDLIKGALILTVAALIIKILSAVYRVPFQNIVGDIGFYIYQQVYPFYGVALVFSTYGFPVIISKLYAERESQNDSIGKQRVLLIGTIFLLVIGVVSFLGLFFGANWLALYMNDPKLALLLKVIAFIFLIFPIISILRGYFQGAGNMSPTAFSQIGEQCVRVGVILVVATILVSKGFDLYIVGAGAVFGSVVGGITAAVILGFFSVKKLKKIDLTELKEIMKFGESSKIIKAMFVQGLAICISSMLLILMQLADSLNLLSLLLQTGIHGEDAKELKGVYDRGQPLVQLGIVVATSMSLSLVPLIASERVKQQSKFLYDKVRLALQISMMIGVGATVGLISIIEPTNMMLFENSKGSDVLAMLSILILLSSIILTITAILQGLEHYLSPAIFIFIGFIIKYLLNELLVPTWGTAGAAFASILSMLFILISLAIKLRSIVKIPILNVKPYVVVLIAAASMFFVLKGYLYLTDVFYDFGTSRLIAFVQALTAVALGGLVYLLIIIRNGLFKQEELAMLPFGSKLIYFLPKKK